MLRWSRMPVRPSLRSVPPDERAQRGRPAPEPGTRRSRGVASALDLMVSSLRSARFSTTRAFVPVQSVTDGSGMRARVSVPVVGVVFGMGCGLSDPALDASTLGLGAGATGTTSNGLNGPGWRLELGWRRLRACAGGERRWGPERLAPGASSQTPSTPGWVAGPADVSPWGDRSVGVIPTTVRSPPAKLLTSRTARSPQRSRVSPGGDYAGQRAWPLGRQRRRQRRGERQGRAAQ